VRTQMKRTWLTVLAALLVLSIVCVYFLQGSHTPSGQPALVVMNSPALSSLQAEFNRTPASLRIVLLLSPT
jgi:CBS-domain-containing membrane protein